MFLAENQLNDSKLTGSGAAEEEGLPADAAGEEAVAAASAG